MNRRLGWFLVLAAACRSEPSGNVARDAIPLEADAGVLVVDAARVPDAPGARAEAEPEMEAGPELVRMFTDLDARVFELGSADRIGPGSARFTLDAAFCSPAGAKCRLTIDIHDPLSKDLPEPGEYSCSENPRYGGSAKWASFIMVTEPGGAPGLPYYQSGPDCLVNLERLSRDSEWAIKATYWAKVIWLRSYHIKNGSIDRTL